MDIKSIVATEFDELFMRMAIEEAQEAAARGEVPVGAVIVDGQQNILARAGNSSIGNSDPAGHAEIIAVRQAGRNTGNYRLVDATIYVTIEPCVMCAGALVHARINRLVYGATDPKAGGVVSCYQIGGDSTLNHEFIVSGNILADECSDLLTSFFKEKRG